MSGHTEQVAAVAEADTEALAAELCRKAHDNEPARYCDECYALANEVMDTDWLAARLFTAEQLTMLHRAVRQKLSRNRNDMARDRRQDRMVYARGKAQAQYNYAALLLVLDALVPEEQR